MRFNSHEQFFSATTQYPQLSPDCVFKRNSLDPKKNIKTKAVPLDKSHSQTGTEHARVH